MSIPSIEEMLKAGLHFGHQSSKWHPKMEPYIFGVRSGVHIIDLEKTEAQLKEAEQGINKIIAKGDAILFVGTKTQARDIIKNEAERAGMPYVMNHWVGGFLTNFKHVIRSAKRLKDLTKKRDTGELNKYTKKEQLQFEKEITKLDTLVGGVQNLEKAPGAIFIVDIKTEKTALLEANKRKIPVIAVCDTNVNPTNVQYVIPANDDAAKGIELIVKSVADMIIEARKKAPKEDPNKAKRKFFAK